MKVLWCSLNPSFRCLSQAFPRFPARRLNATTFAVEFVDYAKFARTYSIDRPKHSPAWLEIYVEKIDVKLRRTQKFSDFFLQTRKHHKNSWGNFTHMITACEWGKPNLHENVSIWARTHKLKFKITFVRRRLCDVTTTPGRTVKSDYVSSQFTLQFSRRCDESRTFPRSKRKNKNDFVLFFDNFSQCSVYPWIRCLLDVTSGSLSCGTLLWSLWWYQIVKLTKPNLKS